MSLFLMRAIEQILTDRDPKTIEPLIRDPQDAFRCIAPVCEPLGCSDCNCAVPADVYAALGKAFAAMERERIARSFDVPAHIHGEAEDWCRAAANDIRSGLK